MLLNFQKNVQIAGRLIEKGDSMGELIQTKRELKEINRKLDIIEKKLLELKQLDKIRRSFKSNERKSTAEEILNHYLWFEEDSDTIDRLRHKLKKRFGVE
jgi:hypothetical protein